MPELPSIDQVNYSTKLILFSSSYFLLFQAFAFKTSPTTKEKNQFETYIFSNEKKGTKQKLIWKKLKFTNSEINLNFQRPDTVSSS